MVNVVIYIGSIILTLLVTLFWRHCTEVVDYDGFLLSRFHVILLFLLSFIPIVGTILSVTVFGLYLGLRLAGCLGIKDGRFTDFWFDKEKEK